MTPAASAIPAADWNRCAGAADPMLSHAFFTALEESGSACADTGWLPRHIILKDAAGKIHGILPLYLKNHSYGEYVFDHAWAGAWERAHARVGGSAEKRVGGSYYPKAQSGIPFTPTPGRRFLVDARLNADEARHALADALVAVVSQLELSSAHITFLSGAECRLLTEAEDSKWLVREGMQFHWHNRDYTDFDDFLEALTARKRKTIRRERRQVADAGVVFQLLQGDDLKPQHWDDFYRFYLTNLADKWGGAYLERAFFDHIHQTMREKILLVLATLDGEAVAGAINFIGTDALYGRNWGSVVHIPFLHFETCYYQAIAYAIAHKIPRIEAGAQGLHKVQRGYVPVPTYSVHHLREPAFHSAVKDFITHETELIAQERAQIQQWTPYKTD